MDSVYFLSSTSYIMLGANFSHYLVSNDCVHTKQQLLTTIFDKIVAKKLTPYSKIIPAPPLTILKHKIVLLVTYQPPTLKGGAGEEYRFAKRFNLANPNRCIS